VQQESKKLITRFFEFAAVFAISVFLIRLGVKWLWEIRWALIIAAIVATVLIVGIRLRTNRPKW
jgi:hypothetical protein